MQNNLYKESYKELLSCIVNISIEMNEVILLKYFDMNLPKNIGHIFIEFYRK